MKTLLTLAAILTLSVPVQADQYWVVAQNRHKFTTNAYMYLAVYNFTRQPQRKLYFSTEKAAAKAAAAQVRANIAWQMKFNKG